MRIRRLGWIGTRTEAAVQTVSFFNDVLGLAMEKHDEDFWVGRLPEGGAVEVFGPTSPHNRHFTTGPVVGFVVDDVDAGAMELRDAGAEELDESHRVEFLKARTDRGGRRGAVEHGARPRR